MENSSVIRMPELDWNVKPGKIDDISICRSRSIGGPEVLTGYNTDIKYKGVVYHVQTEDKGQDNPYLESLVYSRGEILYSKKTPYKDMLDKGADADTLAAVMERQHKTIVEAIRRGFLEQLLGKKGKSAKSVETAVTTSEVDVAEERTLDQVILDYLEAQKQEDHLVLRSGGSDKLVYGTPAELHITAFSSRSNAPLDSVRISVTFKSTVEPRMMHLASGETDDDGAFVCFVELPAFNGGTSALVVIAEAPQHGRAEVKHLIYQ